MMCGCVVGVRVRVCMWMRVDAHNCIGGGGWEGRKCGSAQVTDAW